MTAPQDKETRVWAAMIFPAQGEVQGSVQASKRVHWTKEAARAEAERWIAEMKLGPISWYAIDDQVVIGRNHKHYIVLRSALLPDGEPPPEPKD